jgi:hypothetical protein
MIEWRRAYVEKGDRMIGGAGLRDTMRAGRQNQRGLGVFGSLVVVALAGVAGYYVYQGVSGEDAPQSCEVVLKECMQKCRRTTSDSTAAQACQAACRRDANACR